MKSMNEPEGPSIGFPFNVPNEFLDGEDEEEDNDGLNARKILIINERVKDINKKNNMISMGQEVLK